MSPGRLRRGCTAAAGEWLHSWGRSPRGRREAEGGWVPTQTGAGSRKGGMKVEKARLSPVLARMWAAQQGEPLSWRRCYREPLTHCAPKKARPSAAGAISHGQRTHIPPPRHPDSHRCAAPVLMASHGIDAHRSKVRTYVQRMHSIACIRGAVRSASIGQQGHADGQHADERNVCVANGRQCGGQPVAAVRTHGHTHLHQGIYPCIHTDI